MRGSAVIYKRQDRPGEWFGWIQPCTSGILYNYEYYYIWHLRGVDTKIQTPFSSQISKSLW